MLLLLTQKNLAADFKQFILGNNVLLTATGFMIGIASSVFIKSIAKDLVIPSLYKTTGLFVNKKNLYKLFPDTEYNWFNLFSETISWILMILIAFIIINTIRKLVAKIPAVTQEQQ